jgi:hypothetical protein
MTQSYDAQMAACLFSMLLMLLLSTLHRNP